MHHSVIFFKSPGDGSVMGLPPFLRPSPCGGLLLPPLLQQPLQLLPISISEEVQL